MKLNLSLHTIRKGFLQNSYDTKSEDAPQSSGGSAGKRNQIHGSYRLAAEDYSGSCYPFGICAIICSIRESIKPSCLRAGRCFLHFQEQFNEEKEAAMAE